MVKRLILTALFVGTTAVSLAQTILTGERFKDKQVISSLNVEDLQPGLYEMFFKLSENSIGHPYFVPVSVVKGKNPGPKFMLIAGVHGDELNPILTVNQVKRNLSPETLHGTVTIVHMLNIPGLVNNTRDYNSTGRYSSNTNLNRGIDAMKDTYSEQIYSKLLWEGVLKPNADFAIDVHTGGATKFPFLLYTTHSNEKVNRMAELSGADAVKVELEGTEGAVEDAYLKLGVPAVTYEVGAGSLIEPHYVARAVDGIMNTLIYSGNLKGEFKKFKNKTVFANTWNRISAEHAGMVEYKVKLNDSVKKDDIIAVGYDNFGNVIAQYKAKNDGTVFALRNYPFFEKGYTIGRVAYNVEPKKEEKTNK